MQKQENSEQPKSLSSYFYSVTTHSHAHAKVVTMTGIVDAVDAHAAHAQVSATFNTAFFKNASITAFNKV